MVEAPKVQRRGEGKLVTTLNRRLAADREIDFTEWRIERISDYKNVLISVRLFFILTVTYNIKTRVIRNRTGELQYLKAYMLG